MMRADTAGSPIGVLHSEDQPESNSGTKSISRSSTHQGGNEHWLSKYPQSIQQDIWGVRMLKQMVQTNNPCTDPLSVFSARCRNSDRKSVVWRSTVDLSVISYYAIQIVHSSNDNHAWITWYLILNVSKISFHTEMTFTLLFKHSH